MITRLTFSVACFLALAGAAGATKPNSLTSAEKAAGWKLLFDGSTLSGWRGYKSETPVGWSVHDGALVLAAGRKGDLVTQQQFGDFELTLEWKIGTGGNSGILYRVELGHAAPARSGPEYQLLDNARAKDNNSANRLAGALYGLVAPPRDVTRPVGEWNEARVRVRVWKIEHWLNGVKVAEADLASPAGRTLIAASKFKTWPRFAAISRGHITLQDHGDPVSFRNVKLREL